VSGDPTVQYLCIQDFCRLGQANQAAVLLKKVNLVRVGLVRDVGGNAFQEEVVRVFTGAILEGGQGVQGAVALRFRERFVQKPDAEQASIYQSLAQFCQNGIFVLRPFLDGAQ
jgi:hypothetical protein